MFGVTCLGFREEKTLRAAFASPAGSTNESRRTTEHNCVAVSSDSIL